LEPGYKRITFRPTIPTRLDHAEATYDSVRGTIASSWTRSGSTFTLNVTVPPNATGVVYIPGADPGSVKVSDTVNATFVGKQGNRLVYNVDSGSYRFTMSNR
jgi:alpha-L-rhamnosidase